MVEQADGNGGAVSSVRVDSIPEAHAWVDAYPHASGVWEWLSERRSTRDGGRTLTVELRAPDGERLDVGFDVSSFGSTGGRQRFGVDPTTALDDLMAGVAGFAAANPPHHPGELPRFPVPSERYPGRVIVPLPILAAGDDGRAGLFAPARVVVVTLGDGKPYGVGDFPGFDPDVWPPDRLGDWPPPAVPELPRRRLAATVARFNGLWLRLLASTIEGETYPQANDERREALQLLALLDIPGMRSVYRELSPRFMASLQHGDV